MDRNDVIQILNGCGFFAEIGISVLVERSLVTVDNKNKLRMHDLLRDMGREIIREESPNEPEERSRLWVREEVLDILSKHEGTKAVKGLALKLPRKNTTCLNTKAFKKMNRLRLLQLAWVRLDGDFKYLARDLRWLCWHGFPSTNAPAEFQQESLVAIDLKYSNLKQIWKKGQMLEKLKILNLSHSRDLTETPDFSYLPNLEKLVLKDCQSLSEVSHTIGYLHKLLLINLKDCTGLQNLPRSIYKLKSLETLILSGCSMIDKLEEDIEQMESLTTLIADKTAIRKVPFSIVRSKSIGYISLCGFEGFSRDVFPSLIRSWMSPTNNVISLVQTSVSMSSLVSVDFPYSSSCSLSFTFKDLPKLRSLCVECGFELQLTQDVARILDVLKATNCQKLEASATTSQISNMYTSPLIDGHNQVHISGSKIYLKSLLIQMGMKCQVPNIAKDSILQTTNGTEDSFLLPGDNNSDWLTFSCKGCSVIFEVPKMKGHNLKRMMVFIVYSSSLDNITSEGCQNVLIINYTKTIIQVYKRETLTCFEEEEWQSITSNLEPGNKVEVMVVFGEGFIVEKTSVYLLYDEPIDKEMEHCHAVDEGITVSGDDDKNVSVSGGDDMAADKNFTVLDGDDVDMLADKNVIIFGDDENVSEGKHWHAVNKDYGVSGDDDMAAKKNHDVSGDDDMAANKNHDVFVQFTSTGGQGQTSTAMPPGSRGQSGLTEFYGLLQGEARSLWDAQWVLVDLLDNPTGSKEDQARFAQVRVEGLLQVAQTYSMQSAAMNRLVEIMHSSTKKTALSLAPEKEELAKQVWDLTQRADELPGLKKELSDLKRAHFELEKERDELQQSMAGEKNRADDLAKRLVEAERSVKTFQEEVEGMKDEATLQYQKGFDRAVAQARLLFPDADVAQMDSLKEVRNGVLIDMADDKEEENAKVAMKVVDATGMEEGPAFKH